MDITRSTRRRWLKCASLSLLCPLFFAADASGSAPASTSPPSISGTAEVGGTLTANPGTWTGVPAPTFAYQWQRCPEPGTSTPPGVNWTSRTPAAANDWLGITWGGPAGQETFVAVAVSGSNDRVMTSPDGVTWTAQTSASPNNWLSVVWGGPAGDQKFVAVAGDGGAAGPGNRVMTSPDGVTWTLRATPADNAWWGVTWGGPAGQEKFVAVSSTGSGNRVMTSPDGITWTARSSAADKAWYSVAWGDPPGATPGQFVAVSGDRPGNLVMTSPDGINWTPQTPASDNIWRAVAWGGPAGQQKFVAVSQLGNGPRVMTSQAEITQSCSNIPGETNSTYTLAPVDYGAYVKVEVIAANGVSPNGVASSPASTQVAGQAPGNVAAPTVSGTAQVGQTLTADSGTWIGYPTPTVSVRWRLCDAVGGSCQDIAGATSSTYAPSSSDRGGTIRVEVTATNPVASVSAISPPTSAVEAVPVPSPTTPGLTAKPSNAFSLGPSRASGAVITTVVRVPGAGRTAQVGRARGAGGAACSTSRTSRSAATVILTCRVAARTLPRKCGRSVRVSLRTTFTPVGGAPRSKERVVSLRKRCPTPPVTG